jgi:hypothetical protein
MSGFGREIRRAGGAGPRFSAKLRISNDLQAPAPTAPSGRAEPVAPARRINREIQAAGITTGLPVLRSSKWVRFALPQPALSFCPI